MFTPDQLLQVSLVKFSQTLMQETPDSFLIDYYYDNPNNQNSITVTTSFWIGPTLWGLATGLEGKQKHYVVDVAHHTVYQVNKMPDAARSIATSVMTFEDGDLSSVHRTSFVATDGVPIDLTAKQPSIVLNFEWATRTLDRSLVTWGNNRGLRCEFELSEDAQFYMGRWNDGSFTQHPKRSYLLTGAV